MVTCGVCGFVYEEGNLEEGLNHSHHHREQQPLVLPQKVCDLIRLWADRQLRDIPDEMTAAEAEEKAVAVWVLMHMWYNAKPWQNINKAFAQYEADVRKMYPKTRGLSSDIVRGLP